MAPTKDGSNKRRKANEDSDDDDKEVGAKAEELARIIGKNFFQVEAADEGMGRRLLSVLSVHWLYRYHENWVCEGL